MVVKLTHEEYLDKSINQLIFLVVDRYVIIAKTEKMITGRKTGKAY